MLSLNNLALTNMLTLFMDRFEHHLL